MAMREKSEMMRKTTQAGQEEELKMKLSIVLEWRLVLEAY
jgi:hypothetical protein